MEAGGARTGRRRIIRNDRVPIWFGAPFLVLGLVAFAAGVANLLDELAFGEHGATAQAVVVDLRRQTSEDSTSYYVDYAFSVPGTSTERRGTSSVSRSLWAGLRKGEAVTVTYLTTDPAKHRLGTAEPELVPSFAVMGIGALFALVGPAMFVVALRQRRAPAAAGPGTPTAADAPGEDSLPGPALDVSEAERRRVDVFTRSWFRIVGEVVVAPVGGLALVILAIWSLGRLFEGEIYVALAFAGGFVGTLLLVGGIDGLRRGPSRRLLEVGPAGLWLPGVGRVAWADVAEVRLEEYQGIRRRGLPVRRVTVLADGREVDTATTSVFRRVGIVPRDGGLAERGQGRLSRSLYRGMASVANAVRRDRVVAEAPDIAPFGVGAWEVQPSIEAVVASIRRFVPVVDRLTSPAPDATAAAMAVAPPVAAPSRPAGSETLPLSDAGLREVDAHLAPGGAVQATASLTVPVPPAEPERLAPLVAPGPSSFVPGTPGAAPAPPRPRRVFRRRGFGAGDALALVMPGDHGAAPPLVGVILMVVFGLAFTIVPLILAVSSLGSGQANAVFAIVFAVVGIGIGYTSLQTARRRWRLVTGDDELLTIGPEGLTLRDAAPLSWDAIEAVSVEDGVLTIRPQPGAGPKTTLPLDLFAEDDDEILDAIASYRLVDEQ